MNDPEHQVRVQAEPVVITLPAEIDMSNSDSVGSELSAAMVPGVTLVVADLTSTVFCDSGGLRHLVMAYHQAAAIDAELRLAVQASSVRRVMELTGLFRLMNVYPSVAAALQAEPDTAQA